MGGKFTPAAGLDRMVAERLLAPKVKALADVVTDEAKHRAPAGKEWVTRRDEVVRESHRHADGQLIPENLRYEIEQVDPRNHHKAIPGSYELAREPRDENLSAANYYNCRCISEPDAEAVSRSISVSDTSVEGTRVSATVGTSFPRIAESHYATAPDQAVPFMHEATAAAARR